MNLKKIIMKQTIVLILIEILSILFFSLSKFLIVNEFLYFYSLGFLFLYTCVLLLFFLPVSIFYYVKFNKQMNFDRLNLYFQSMCWFVLLVVLFFIFLNFKDLFVFAEPGLNIFYNFFLAIKSLNMGDTLALSTLLPFFIIAGLCVWTIKINKSLI